MWKRERDGEKDLNDERNREEAGKEKKQNENH